MKGEYLESPSDHPGAATPPTLFAKLHHPFSLHHFRPSPPSPDNPSPSPKAKPPGDPASGDGSTIEVVRRRRGRPPGSKNKPKPPLIITRDPEPSLSPYILEVPCGSDVVASLHSFCRRRSLSLSVLSASGSVSDFTLRQPPSSPGPGATLTFRGLFDILSISATVFPRSPPASSGAAAAAPIAFSISLAGPQGQIVGGSVAGPLVAAGPVFVVAASFNSPTFHRLTDAEEEAENARRATSEAGSGGGEGQSPQMTSGGDSGPGHQRQAEPVYGRHMSSDAIWAPAPRQPPPPPPPYN
ncbi:AT-hook motif nuclear-localized protein 28-like [Rhodamnia argentea]|uniref:AT-hook motif nuclear-localized protein 28-like n=1 Tax=Rhodamnia argentea TaxID=178133 RepID=A0A8B8P0T3_9MYRT|nr:AT-hook motif nuclear-localized protein 28-like [Rhodamnia argentea]